MEPGFQGGCNGVGSPELDSLICFGEVVEWGASHGRAALPLRLKKRSQVGVLRITCPVLSVEFLSPDLDLLRQVSKERGSVLREIRDEPHCERWERIFEQ